MIHKIKILEQFADEIISGNKNFEIRKNDRGYQKGDLIRFEVADEYGNRLDGRRYIKHPMCVKL